MVKISFNDFQDLASLKTLNNRNERNMDKLLTFSNKSSTNDKATIMKSNTFQPSWWRIEYIYKIHVYKHIDLIELMQQNWFKLLPQRNILDS